MAYQIEFISKKDVEVYRLNDIDKRHVMGGTSSREWVIDREKNTYLRQISVGREEFSKESLWTFFWRGTMLEIKLELVASEVRPGDAGWSKWEMTFSGLPEPLSAKKEAILNDLGKALEAYKDAGMYSQNTDYSVTLDSK